MEKSYKKMIKNYLPNIQVLTNTKTNIIPLITSKKIYHNK